jgi:DNA-binding beta-propeller fold protein YncE
MRAISLLLAGLVLVSAGAFISPTLGIPSAGVGTPHALSPFERSSNGSAPTPPLLGIDGSAVAYDPDNGFLFVSNPGNDTVLVVNGSTRELAAPPIPLNRTPGPIAYDSANQCVYIVIGNNLAIVNAATDRVIVANFSLGSDPLYALAVDPNPDRVLATDSGNGEVWIINGSNQTVTGPPLAIPQAGPVAFDPETGRAYVGVLFPYSPPVISMEPLAIVDPANDTVVNSTVGPPLYTNQIAFDAANGELYVSITLDEGTPSENYSVVAINPSSLQYTVIPDGMNATAAIVPYPSAGLVYVGAGREVQVLNSSTNKFELADLNLDGDYAPDGFPLGDFPDQEPAALDTTTGWLYLTDVDCYIFVGTGAEICEYPMLAVHEDRLYPATIQENGLPAKTSWGVSVWVVPLQGQSWTTTTLGTEVSLPLWNGTYVYYASTLAGYRVQWSGTVTVNGSAATVAVLTLDYRPFEYSVQLTELGLRADSPWTVVATGGPASNSTTATSTQTNLTLILANGSYMCIDRTCDRLN